MEAQDLRIGNYITRKPHKLWIPFIVKDGEISEQYAKNCKPIPLTEEILFKCGFIKDGDNYLQLNLQNEFYLGAYGHGLNYNKYEVILTDTQNNELTIVKHLHQLQNLYYALTGKELDIKL